MRRLVIAGAIALLPLSAYAQDGRAVTAKSDSEKRRDAEIEKAYKDTIKRTSVGTPQAPNDPWQSVRPTPTTADTGKH